MNADLAGAKLCLSDSRFIQVIAKSLSISCKEVRTLQTYTDRNQFANQQLLCFLKKNGSYHSALFDKALRLHRNQDILENGVMRRPMHMFKVHPKNDDLKPVLSTGAGSHPRCLDSPAGMCCHKDRRHRGLRSPKRNGNTHRHTHQDYDSLLL